MPRADAVTTAEGGPPPKPPHASAPPTPHRAPVHPTRPRPGPSFASGLALDAANPPFADGIVSPPRSPGAPLPPAPRHLPRQRASCAARSGGGGGGARVSAPHAGERGERARSSSRAFRPLSPPLPSARSPFPPSFSSFFSCSPFPLFSLLVHSFVNSVLPPPSLSYSPPPLPTVTLSLPPSVFSFACSSPNVAPRLPEEPSARIPRVRSTWSPARGGPSLASCGGGSAGSRGSGSPDRGHRGSPSGSGRRRDVPAKAEQTPADQTGAGGISERRRTENPESAATSCGNNLGAICWEDGPE
uniref:vegetative cell wall protein gp1-like isoform X1 n=1 Tax=Halichoerus grypus TaxID=9711 RepID=UPI00165A07C2|nr:vegetative cell wall protein gp1-like isoform X1 [Halichoerus grypus]